MKLAHGIQVEAKQDKPMEVFKCYVCGIMTSLAVPIVVTKT